MRIKTNFKWVIMIILVSIAATMVFTLASTEVLGRINYVAAFAILAAFIILGIVFDILGVAVTAATEAPFHSMAAHRENGAMEALLLIKSADRVSSFCNDVVGDVSGIVSGGAAALIAARLMQGLGTGNILLPLLISGAVSGLTIGGKAIGKTYALNNSTVIVQKTGKLLYYLRLKPYSKK